MYKSISSKCILLLSFAALGFVTLVLENPLNVLHVLMEWYVHCAVVSTRCRASPTSESAVCSDWLLEMFRQKAPIAKLYDLEKNKSQEKTVTWVKNFAVFVIASLMNGVFEEWLTRSEPHWCDACGRAFHTGTSWRQQITRDSLRHIKHSQEPLDLFFFFLSFLLLCFFFSFNHRTSACCRLPRALAV